MHCRFTKNFAGNSYNETWLCLQNGRFKREIESFLVAAEGKAFRTNWIKVKIVKSVAC